MFFVKIFGSKGTETDKCDSYFDDGMSFAGDLRSGASYDIALYCIYDGDGTYYVKMEKSTQVAEIAIKVNASAAGGNIVDKGIETVDKEASAIAASTPGNGKTIEVPGETYLITKAKSDEISNQVSIIIQRPIRQYGFSRISVGNIIKR